MESKTELGSKRVGVLALQRYLEVPTDDLMGLKTIGLSNDCSSWTSCQTTALLGRAVKPLLFLDGLSNDCSSWTGCQTTALLRRAVKRLLFLDGLSNDCSFNIYLLSGRKL